MSKRVLIFDKQADWLCGQLGMLCPRYAYLPEAGEAVAPERAADASILCALAPRIAPELVRAMPQLEWVQALTTGVDNLLSMDALPPRVTITNSRGIHGPQMSELAILLMLASTRRFPDMVHNQSRGVWDRWPQPVLSGKTVCIVGLGIIAEALAERTNAFGMRIIGVSDGRTEVAGFAKIFPRSGLTEAVSEADFVVVVVPYTPETHHLIGDRVLRAMKRGAVLINVSRGGCISEAALETALRSGHIAAALDVFETEPLPASSPFWSLPNVIVTPHIGGMSDIYAQQVLPIIADNLEAYATGGVAALKNCVRTGQAQADEPAGS